MQSYTESEREESPKDSDDSSARDSVRLENSLSVPEEYAVERGSRSAQDTYAEEFDSLEKPSEGSKLDVEEEESEEEEEETPYVPDSIDSEES